MAGHLTSLDLRPFHDGGCRRFSWTPAAPAPPPRVSFIRRFGMDCQGMYAIGDFGAEQRVDHAMPIDAALALEHIRYHFYSKVGLTPALRLARSGHHMRMPRMLT